jgi:hypothetical protein
MITTHLTINRKLLYSTGENIMNNLLIKAGAVVLLLSGCASSGPTITSNANPNIDMSAFSTYNFMQPLATDRENGVRTPLSSMLMNSISREMAARGFQQSNSPDMLINVFVSTEERMDVRQTPTTSSFHSYRMGRYSAWPSQTTTVRQYTRGTLSIDLVDAANNVLAWEGVAQNRLRDDLREITQDQTDEVVTQTLAMFMPPKVTE